jgi:hypothetical protein
VQHETTQTATLSGVNTVYSPAHVAPLTSRYRVNLALFCALSLLATFGFYLHMQTLVSQVLVISGTLTVWSVWKLLEQVVISNVDRKDMTRRMLERENATQYLGFAIALAIAGLLLTSSLYVVYGPEADAKSVTIRVDEESVGPDGSVSTKQVLPTQTLHASRSVLGKVFWARRPRALIVTIIDPPGKTPAREELRWWRTALHVNVFDNDKFPKDEYSILRLAPLMKLPVDGSVASDYSLRIMRRGRVLATVHEARLRTHYFGRPQGELKRLVPYDDPAYTTKVERRLDLPGVGDTRTEIRNALLSAPSFLGTEPLRRGDKLEVVVTKAAAGVVQWRSTGDITIGAAPIQTCFMEISPNALAIDCS